MQHWYTTGAAVLMNVVFGDLTAILGLIEFVRPDKWIIRYLVAPNAPTQAEMNQIYALDSDFYLPFRYQACPLRAAWHRWPHGTQASACMRGHICVRLASCIDPRSHAPLSVHTC